MRRSFLCTVFVVVSAGPVSAQPGAALTPMAVDLRKVPVGTWAEYSTTAGPVTVKTRWAFVAREKHSNILETMVDGGPAAPMGRRMVMRIVVASDPLAPGGTLKQMIMQMGDQDPVEMPIDAASVPGQQFQKPDPKKMIGKERITVAAGSFNATHYRDSSPDGTADVWISEDVPPLGMVKVKTTPSPGAKDPAGRPMPSVTMELVARGKDAKATITKPAKPFNPAAYGGVQGKPTGVSPKGADPARPTR